MTPGGSALKKPGYFTGANMVAIARGYNPGKYHKTHDQWDALHQVPWEFEIPECQRGKSGFFLLPSESDGHCT